MKLIASKFTSFAVLLGVARLDDCLGWSPRHAQQSGTIPRTTTTTLLSSIDDEAVGTTRRDAVSKTLSHLIGGAAASAAVLATGPGAAHADVTNKIASSTALRALTRAQAQLPTKLLPDVKANDYVGVKARLREPPFDNVRKNGQILVRGGEDGPKVGELVKKYKELIVAIEKIDNTASLGMRGRTIDPFEMSKEYEVIVAAIDSFLKVGAEAAEIPLQAQPSMQENLQTGSITTTVLTGDAPAAAPVVAPATPPPEAVTSE